MLHNQILKQRILEYSILTSKMLKCLDLDSNLKKLKTTFK